MNRQRVFRRNGQPLRSQLGQRKSGPHALIILGIDNIGALEDLFGEPLGDEIIDTVETRIASALPDRARGCADLARVTVDTTVDLPDRARAVVPGPHPRRGGSAVPSAPGRRSARP